MACDSKLHTIILWHVISVKLNIGQKIPGLEITTLNLEKMQHVIELMQTYRTDV